MSHFQRTEPLPQAETGNDLQQIGCWGPAIWRRVLRGRAFWGLEPVAAACLWLAASELTANSSQGYSAYSQWFQWLGPTGAVLAGITLVASCFVAWCLNLIALPGNWISVALLAAYAWLGPQDSRVSIGYLPVIAAGLCALVGEVLEFLASAVGAKRAGASRRSTLYALIGSFAGAILGALVGLPVPVIGPVLAAILFAGFGATAGAMYGEWTDGRPWKENWNIGHAAFWGRTFGTLGKFSAGLVIFLIAAVSIVL